MKMLPFSLGLLENITTKERDKRKISRFFCGSVFLIAVLLIVIPLMTVYLLTQAYDEQIRSKTRYTSFSIQQTVRTFIDGAYNLSYELSLNHEALYAPADGPDAGISPILAYAAGRNEFFELLTITNAIEGSDNYGWQVSRSVGDLGNRASRWWFSHMTEFKQPFVSHLYISIATGLPCASIFIPMYIGSDEMTHIFNADISLTYIQGLVNQFANPSDGRYSFIIDSEGVVIAHPVRAFLETRTNYYTLTRAIPATEAYGNMLPAPYGEAAYEDIIESDCFKAVIRAVMDGKSGLEIIDEGSNTYYISFEPIALPGYSGSWSVITLQDRDIAMNVVFRLTTQVILIIVVILAALAALIFVFFKTLHRTLISLESARTEAEQANKSKSTFLANMSHDMRTPLNAILGMAELSFKAEGLNDELYSNLEKIEGAGITLLNIVSTILDISKIETGKLELLPDEYDTPGLINSALTQSILHIEEKPIQFILNIAENFPAKLYGDELRIKQILNNLLSNAFKFTMQGTVELTVKCERDGDDVLLTFAVRDTGIGIQPENIPKLFDDYAQVDTEANRKIIGTGLGLSIAKRFAELMDGSVSVESEYGKGSVFTVWFRQKHITDAVIGKEVVEGLKDFRYSAQKRRQSDKIPQLSLPYARVLVVDDMVTNLDVARGLMKRYKMKIDCVLSGPEAIEAVRDESIRYNAIFMDHMMPGMDGIEATRLIREIGTDYAKNIPIIAFTANAIVGSEEMFLENGFQAFISKPISIARLDAIIREWVQDEKQDKLYIPPDENEHIAPKDKKIDLGKIAGITGLNIEKGLNRFGNDEDTYINVLRSYAVNIPPLLDKIQTVDKDSPEEYANIVHGLKGSSRGICADETGDKAEALENAANSGDYDYIDTHNTAFVETTLKLVSDINEMLRQIQIDKPKQRKDSPDIETLNKLREACVRHDMDGADKAVEELESFEYESGNELVAWLRENAEQMNYAEIAKKLSE